MKKPVITRYKVNGKVYKNFEDIPENIRKLMDKDNNGKSDFLEEIEKNPSKRKWQISVNKTEPNNEPAQEKDYKKIVIGTIILLTGSVLIYYAINLN